MLNKEIQEAIAALKVIGRSQIPMAVAVRMATCRRVLEGMADDVEEVRIGLVARHRRFTDIDGTEIERNIDATHPNAMDFTKEWREVQG